MKKYYLRIMRIGLLGLALIWLPGMPLYTEESAVKDTTDPAAKEVFLKALENMEQVKGFYFTGEENTTEEDTGSGKLISKKSSAEGVWQKETDITTIEISKEGEEITVYQRSNQTVKKNPSNNQWQVFNNCPPFSPILPSLNLIKTHKDLLRDISFIKGEKLMGKNCKKVAALLKIPHSTDPADRDSLGIMINIRNALQESFRTTF